MQLSSISLAITRLTGGLFSPRSIFTTGVNGAWYDPSDINLTWRRNLLTYTEQFDNAAWVKSATTVTANAVTAPDGTLTADKLVENAATAQHVLQSSSVTTASGSVYVASAYVKAVEVQYAQIGIDGANYSSVTFDVVNGVLLRTNYVSINQYVAGSAQIVSVGNGWFRVSAAFTASATSYFTVKLNRPNINTQDPSYPGDGTSGIYIWGAQLEVGSTATPYQRITDGIQDYLQYQAQPVLYQNSAGTIPVTAVEQPVGLMLDKSKGLVLGSQLVTGATFTANSLNTAGIVNGATFTAAAAGSNASFPAGVTPGRFYEVTYTVSGLIAGSVYVDLGGNSAAVTRTANGTYTDRKPALGNTNFYVGSSSASTTATITVSSIRELPGNHAYNPTPVGTANFPVLSARYNLLTKTERFDDADWIKVRCSIGANVTTAPDGTLTANKVIEDTTASNTHIFYQTIGGVNGLSCISTIYLKAAERTIAWFGSGGGIPQQVKINLSTGQVLNTPAVPYSVTAVGSGWYKVVVTSTQSGVSGPVVYLCDASGNSTYTGDGTSGIYVWGADLRVANDALNQPAYQRVNTASDYDTVGFKPYLRFNGVNQWLQTNSIDFTYGDKMFFAAGVRKLSDAAQAVVLEAGTTGTDNGSFTASAPRFAGLPSIGFRSRGTIEALANEATLYSAPTTNILTGLGDISGDRATLRVNGTQAAISTSDQGTGNFGNYPLYIGARAGSSLYFNGRLYGLVVAGKQASNAEITSTETYLNQRTGAY